MEKTEFTHKFIRITKIFIWILITSMIVSGCNLLNLLYPEPTPTIVPTATTVPPKELNICLGYEPRSLYAYKAASAAEQEVLQVITDGPIDIDVDGNEIPVLLTKIPSFTDGSASFSPVELRAGDAVVNAAGDLVVFESGTAVFPSGCTGADCVVEWDGVSNIQVDQLTVRYDLKPGLQWSDGEPMSAADIVYAFEIAADPITPVNKRNVDLTQKFTALDDVTIEWTGMPGLVTDAFEEFLWTPLPAHAWQHLNAGELLNDENVNKNPLSSGPFKIEEWKTGEYIRLMKNPFFHRIDEGLPSSDIVTFRFLSTDDPASLLTAAGAACDIVSPSAIDMQDVAFLEEHAAEAGMQLQKLQPAALEMLAFGITPVSYDDYYYPYGADRPDIFGDARTRQAIAYCIDKGTIGNKLVGSSVEIADSFLPEAHSLSDGEAINEYAYDPTKGIELLTQVGWLDADLDPDTPITAMSVFDVPYGTPFSIDLLVSDSPLRNAVAGEIASSLSMCGIGVNVTSLPVNEFYKIAPDGQVFGRQFDMALFSVQSDAGLDCSMFKSSEIPTEANYWLGETTGGANFVGYTNEAYDQLCEKSGRIGLDEGTANQSYVEALKILNDEFPVIPIYFHPKVLLISSDVCGYEMGYSNADELMRSIEDVYNSGVCP